MLWRVRISGIVAEREVSHVGGEKRDNVGIEEVDLSRLCGSFVEECALTGEQNFDDFRESSESQPTTVGFGDFGGMCVTLMVCSLNVCQHIDAYRC